MSLTITIIMQTCQNKLAYTFCKRIWQR